MKGEEWTQDITLDILPPQHKKLAEIIGVEETIRLCETWGGAALYIPMPDGIKSAVRAEMIRREYNGYNATKLAKRFGLTPRMVLKIVEGLNPQIDGQVSLFDSSV